MQFFQLLPDSALAVMSVLGLALLASLAGLALQSGRLKRQAQQLQQQESQLAGAAAALQQEQEQGRQLGARLRDMELAHSSMQAQLENLQSTEQRLLDDLQQRREASAQLEQKLDVLRQKYHDCDGQLQAVQAENKAGSELVRDLRVQLHEQGEEAKQLQERYQLLSVEHAELQTTLQRREEHFKEQMQQLAETRQSLGKEFENLANKIFEEKGKTFTHTSQASIDTMLKPFREQIKGFQERINAVHDASLQGNTSLQAEIKRVLDIGMQMSKEASNLTQALKGDSQQRGAWGEAQLRRTLEMSGLLEDAHFEVQSSFRDADGRYKQTDYLVKLPDGKHIIIDSKVTLNAYDRVVSAQSPEEYQLAMVEHIKAVRKHIDDLAGKDYSSLAGVRSPSFVLMFMPVEPAYIEALKHSKDLFEYGYKKGIVLVSHTTLIPILRTVSNLWMIERSNVEAREISERAGDIYNQVCVVAERLSKLGGTLATVSNHYNSTVTALAGQQGLYGKVDRFSQLSARVSKSLPALETNHLDFESERLALIVEPLPELPAEPGTEAQQQD